jgi:hypothetical protein
MQDGYLKIYSSLNTAEARMVKFLLDNNGIETIIENEDMTPLFGMTSAKDAETRLWVPKEKYEEASALLAEKKSLDLSGVKMARCPQCGELVCDIFDYCWNCQTNMKTGEPAPPPRHEKAPGPAAVVRRPSLWLVFLTVLLTALISFIAYRCFHPHYNMEQKKSIIDTH